MRHKGNGRALAQPDLRFEKTAIAITVGMMLGLFALVANDYLSRVAGKAIPVATKPSPSHGAIVPKPASGLVTVSMLKPTTVHRIGSTSKLTALFERIGYKLERVVARGEVPRLFMAALPGDLHNVPRSAQRKLVFIKTALPLILHVNELIRADRDHVEALRRRVEQGKPLSALDNAWLTEKAALFGLKEPDFDALLRRIDIIPPSLALAQSAEESGWGTSRFAREGNALFGQRIWRGEHGIVPRERKTGKKFRVRAFGHLIDGVKSYAHNLNSHPAYAEFRRQRAILRAAGYPIRGTALAGALRGYSERGDAYIKTIRTIMRVNGLPVFDTVELGDHIEFGPPVPDA